MGHDNKVLRTLYLPVGIILDAMFVLVSLLSVLSRQITVCTSVPNNSLGTRIIPFPSFPVGSKG